MERSIGANNVIIEEYLWDVMDESPQFNEFIGQCITHFVHFVVPRRDQTQEIAQDYPVPIDIDAVGGDRILLTRKDSGNVIFIDWWR